MADLLLELFSEEIPARMQPKACDDLKRLIEKALKDAQLRFDAMEAYATPRRLALHVTGLPTAQSDVREERRGPKADAPDKAIAGFLGSVGLSRDQLEEREDKKGTFLYAVIDKKGAPTVDVLAAIIPQIIRSFPWQKSMRWGDASITTESLRWVRPLQSLLCVFDGAVVPFEVDGIHSGNETKGHRFHAPDSLKVKDFEGYSKALEEAYVILDPAKRMDQIVKEANALALISKVEIVRDDALVAENAGLNEWPNVLMGSFDAEFLNVPDEVLTATMRGNQKYFSLRDPKTKKLTNKFLCVANLEAKDGGRSIIAGNEKVLSARLSDAKFFWDQDRKTSLEDMASQLGAIKFHEKLGSVGEKVERVAKLAHWLGTEYGIGVPKLNEEAAKLAKADLVSSMVFEFPDVQGVIGRYYADQQGKDPRVSTAIQEHYAPQGPSDACPTEGVSVAVALADKMDTLVGFFAIDEKPTGSKDPFALRRAALGVIRLIVENALEISIPDLIRTAFVFTTWSTAVEFTREHLSKKSKSFYNEKDNFEFSLTRISKKLSLRAYSQTGKDIQVEGEQLEEILVRVLQDVFGNPKGITNLELFFQDRLKNQQLNNGLRHDVFDAVIEVVGMEDAVGLIKRAEALQEFLSRKNGSSLLGAYKRAANIIKKESQSIPPADSYTPYPDMPIEEQNLYDQFYGSGNLEDAFKSWHAMGDNNFAYTFEALSKLKAPIDEYLEEVTISDGDRDKTANRLALLTQFTAHMKQIADFSRIEG